jgi:hypothetical protein
MPLKVNNAFKKITCTKESQSLKNLGVIYVDSKLKNMSFMINKQLIWLNIKSLNNVKFEIKARLWTCF